MHFFSTINAVLAATVVGASATSAPAPITETVNVNNFSAKITIDGQQNGKMAIHFNVDAKDAEGVECSAKDLEPNLISGELNCNHPEFSFVVVNSVDEIYFTLRLLRKKLRTATLWGQDMVPTSRCEPDAAGGGLLCEQNGEMRMIIDNAQSPP
ncbi:hypothetical protein DCS_04213 [Drechmeria coniospora]|uniref:AA1-like domain-containing protein n=1 Tax=Drechmeria coniospora TaxID=98403 RepID=A0A151GJE2_DRECN|nr:hypothetical protein DCS_04213 [Drechmeria coniospora]KYK57206.1 hypothetical protein DCS_04213 [Drechmeria coniospora]